MRAGGAARTKMVPSGLMVRPQGCANIASCPRPSQHPRAPEPARTESTPSLSTQIRWWPVSAMYVQPSAPTARPHGLKRAVPQPGRWTASGDGGIVPSSTSIAAASIERKGFDGSVRSPCGTLWQGMYERLHAMQGSIRFEVAPRACSEWPKGRQKPATFECRNGQADRDTGRFLNSGSSGGDPLCNQLVRRARARAAVRAPREGNERMD